MSSKLTPTALPTPPKEYEVGYMDRLVKQIALEFTKQRATTPITCGSDLSGEAGFPISGLTIINPPISSTGSPPDGFPEGSVWCDTTSENSLKIITSGPSTDQDSLNLANTTDPALGDALIGFRQSNASGNLTGAVGRTVHEKLQESVSVKDFGAVGNGLNDDTEAIQAAINYATLNGVEVYFPGALYRTTAELFIDRSFNSNDPTEGGRYGITLRGDGPAASMISSDHAGNCIRFLGGPGAGWHTGFVISGLCLTQPNHSQLVGSKGLYLDQCAWVQIFDFDIAWFEYGIYGVDLLTSNFSDGTIRLNEYGFKFQRATRSNPNNITFKGVTIVNNQTYGGWLVRPSGVSFFGGSIESNGYTGIIADPNSGGLYVEQPGAEGSVGVNLNGVYIENNNGRADVHIVATGSTGATTTMNTFTGCTFLRFSNTRYVTNNILIEGANPSKISVSGCGFKNFAPYVADPSRIWIAAGDAQVFDGGGNVFSDASGVATEISKSVFAPIASYHQLPYAALPSASLFPNGIQYCADGGGGTSRPALAVSDGTNWWQVVLGQFGGSVQSTGTANTLPRGWTVSRASAGVYVVTHNLNITGTQYSVVATPIGTPGTGYCSGKSKSNNSFEIYFANTAGAAADMAFDFTLSVI